MHQFDNGFLDRRIEVIWGGLRDAIAEEVATLRREGWPVYVLEDGRVVDVSGRDGVNGVGRHSEE